MENSFKQNSSYGIQPYETSAHTIAQTPAVLERISDINYSQADVGSNPLINLASGRLTYSFEDLSVGHGNFNISLCHIFNSKLNAAFSDKLVGFGNNWKLNFSQIVIRDNFDEYGYPVYKYLDDAGEIHRFVRFDVNRYYDANNAKVTLSVKSQEYIISDGVGNKLVFNSLGLLTKSISCHNSSIQKIFEYDSFNRLISVYDSRTVINKIPKSRIELDYDGEYLSSVTSYGNFNRKLFRLSYDYSDGNLVSVKQVAFNKSGEPCVSKQLLEFTYSNNLLTEITDSQNSQAYEIEYYENGRVNKVSAGIIKEDTVSMGMTDISSPLQSGQTYSGLTLQRRFVTKSFNTYSYKYNNSSDTVAVETDVTNENNITLAYFIDRNARITSCFELTGNDLKTIRKQRDRHWIKNSDNVYSTINGNGTTVVANGKLGGIQFKLNLARNQSEKYCRNFNYSFWLKTTKSYKMLEAKVLYKYTDIENIPIDQIDSRKEITTTVYLNPCANGAWQKVSLPITVPDGYNSSSLKFMEITLLADKKVCADDSYFNDIGFSPAPTAEMFLYQTDRQFWALKLLENVTVDNEIVPVSKDFYLTETDIMATFANKYNSQQSFDLVYNNGTKRRLVTSDLSLSFPLGITIDCSRSCPFKIITLLPEGDAKVETEYEYQIGAFTVKNVYYKTINGVSYVSETSSLTDFKGKTICSKDEYDIESVYTYDDYGNLTKVEIKNGKLVVNVQNYIYDAEGRLVSSFDGLNGQTITHDDSDRVSRITESYLSLDTPADTNHSTQLNYGVFADKLIKTTEYDGQNEAGTNQVSYENGHVRTISDGVAKYGIKYDLARGSIDFTQFDGNTEKLVQRDKTDLKTISVSDTETILGKEHTSTFYDANGVQTGYSAAEIDCYGKLRTVSRSDGSNYKYVYKNITESDFVNKPASCLNQEDNTSVDYSYDEESNLIGWREAENGETKFEVRQIAPHCTKYTIAPSKKHFSAEEYFAEIEYDKYKFVSPRITGVKYLRDYNESFDKPEDVLYERKYKYDALGNMVFKLVNQSSQDIMSAETDYSYDLSTRLLKGTYYREKHKEETAQNNYVREVKFDVDYTHNVKGLLADERLFYNWSYVKNNKEEDFVGKTHTKSYEYDELNRITREQNSAFGIDRKYSYRKDGRMDAIFDSKFGDKKFFYDGKGRLVSINNTIRYSYDNYGNRIQRWDGGSTFYDYSYGGTLVKAGNTTYGYNVDGVRCQKERNGIVTKYYLDGSKILGENRGEDELRYFYDLEGLCLLTYNGTPYTCVTDGQGNVTMLVDESGNAVAYYCYDVFGHCNVYDKNWTIDYNKESIGNINPFRWKGFYYDSETGFYYANGSYYDPETGKYLDAAPITSVADNAYSTRGLDRNGLMCNNVLELAGSPNTVFTTVRLSMDTTYDPGMSWWEKVGKTVNNWWRNVPQGAKIMVGAELVVISVILAYYTAGISLGLEAELLGSGAIISQVAQTALIELTVGIGFSAAGWAISSAVSGQWNVNGLTETIADTIFFTGLFMFVSTSINYIKYVCRSRPVTTAELQSYELDPRSISDAKQGSPSWDTFRRRVWKNEAKYRPEIYGKDNICIMQNGLAPQVGSKPMNLHHVVGKANDMYNVIKVTQAQHIAIHKAIGYHYNAKWTLANIISYL